MPSNVALRVDFEGGVSTLNVDRNRFPETGRQTFQSPDYETAANRVDLRIEAGASTVNIR